jgi:hypothetical protein
MREVTACLRKTTPHSCMKAVSGSSCNAKKVENSPHVGQTGLALCQQHNMKAVSGSSCNEKKRQTVHMLCKLRQQNVQQDVQQCTSHKLPAQEHAVLLNEGRQRVVLRFKNGGKQSVFCIDCASMMCARCAAMYKSQIACARARHTLA